MEFLYPNVFGDLKAKYVSNSFGVAFYLYRVNKFLRTVIVTDDLSYTHNNMVQKRQKLDY